ncbi:IucA/IucC family protein [Bacillus sp. SL00103]
MEAEQSLLLGHLTHPTPKSRQGMTEEEEAIYSPELKELSSFITFKAHHSIVLQDLSITVCKPYARRALAPSTRRKREPNTLVENGEYVLIPIHPLQVKVVMEKAFVNRYIEGRKLTYLGPMGSEYTATSSFRTVYQKGFCLYVQILCSCENYKLLTCQ